ncbi:hypothetical protein [Priestia megaterium]|uniref:hypothetical protein n=1 Tax=Priestia megaterium TaxID=1404 RepID=UPI00272F4E16|nr:hypothetical protein [Priestia megaterium]MDP1442453.1 hypothetical protein [Priestia megaterium]MDP1471547.1 hypothetical protein [Priestia megaterium]
MNTLDNSRIIPTTIITQFVHLFNKFSVLMEVINKQLEVPQPLLTEEQMQQINFTLIEALHIIRTGNV